METVVCVENLLRTGLRDLEHDLACDSTSNRHLNQNCPDPTFDLSHVRDFVGRQAAVLSSVRLPTNTEGGLATAISY